MCFGEEKIDKTLKYIYVFGEIKFELIVMEILL